MWLLGTEMRGAMLNRVSLNPVDRIGIFPRCHCYASAFKVSLNDIQRI